ncbi:MAG: methyltransferase domain-containing protein [Planctomycetaceae bacterium]|nr:methyltransferase domain-containing protein [Planctomycetales bacterium]MCB9938331.1 methyltransferase domain-containing protein [Planctomycetaceae bacterium]
MQSKASSLSATSRIANTNEAIVTYYDGTLIDYRWVMSTNRHFGLHFGYYDERHSTCAAACQNSNRTLAEKARLRSGMRVLDAGCGIGGSSVWLAQHHEVYVTGVTLSLQQCRAARELAQQVDVADRTEFHVHDYLALPFADRSFDIIWALESVCYTTDKADFLREAMRVLRPGGRLVLADGFRRDHRLPSHQERRLTKWLHCWAVPGFAVISRFIDSLAAHGFVVLEQSEYTNHVLPFSRYLWTCSLFCLPAAIALRACGLLSHERWNNLIGAIIQYPSLKSRDWEYWIVVAEKPLSLPDRSRSD